MVVHVRMVGRALERDVERDLEPERARPRDQPPKVIERAKLRVQRLVAAFGRADRPRAADVVRVGGKRVVAPLAPLAPDRMNRRQIKDVEAHLRDVRQTLFAIAQGAVRAGIVAARAGKHFVPRAEARQRAVDDERQLGRKRCRRAAVGMAHRDGGHRFVHGHGAQRAGIALVAQPRGPPEELPAVVSGRAARRRTDQQRADLRRDMHVLGIDTALEMVSPGQEGVDPRLDRVPIAAERVDDKGAPPAIVAERGHRRLVPAGLVLAAVAQDTGDQIVPVGIAVGLDLDAVADDALDREAPAVDRRRDALDHGANLPVAGKRCCYRHRQPPARCRVRSWRSFMSVPASQVVSS